MLKDSCVTALYALGQCEVTNIKDVRNRKIRIRDK